MRISLTTWMFALSHALCLQASSPTGGSVSGLAHQMARASSTDESECSWISIDDIDDRCKMDHCNSYVQAAEAKTAKGASVDTLRIPRPSSRTRRLA